MKLMAKAKAQTNGHLKRLTPEELAEITHAPVYKTPEEITNALLRAERFITSTIVGKSTTCSGHQERVSR
jgi:hypothetical protein